MSPDQFRRALLGWYDANKRSLPWRALPGVKPEPYHVWLSEIMLQQTTVTAVKPYYQKFLSIWPTVFDLANASHEDVMNEWAGLGYYARARNLHKCAQIISYDLNGMFPQTQKELKTLPGVGDYTSAAILTIAFNQPATVVDGNVERVMSRYFAEETPIPKSKKKLKTYAALFFENYKERPGDLAQAMMDLGAGVCTVKRPNCMVCPISKNCQGWLKGTPELYPKRVKKKKKPQKTGYIYWVESEDGYVLLHRRPAKGLLGGTVGLPTSDWSLQLEEIPHLEMLRDIQAQSNGAYIVHSFTHFDLKLYLYRGQVTKNISNEYYWQDPKALSPDHFPTVFRKAVLLFLRRPES